MSATLAEPTAVPADVSVWPRYPTLYEIDTWVWLSELKQKYGKNLDLSSLPSTEWDAIAAFGLDAVWLMGVCGRVCACGRDPYFPAWPDGLQLSAFEPGLRQAVIETISTIAQQCDGVRCDMAMVMLNPIFERTWGDHAGHARQRSIGWM